MNRTIEPGASWTEIRKFEDIRFERTEDGIANLDDPDPGVRGAATT